MSCKLPCWIKRFRPRRIYSSLDLNCPEKSSRIEKDRFLNRLRFSFEYHNLTRPKSLKKHSISDLRKCFIK